MEKSLASPSSDASTAFPWCAWNRIPGRPNSSLPAPSLLAVPWNYLGKGSVRTPGQELFGGTGGKQCTFGSLGWEWPQDNRERARRGLGDNCAILETSRILQRAPDRSVFRRPGFRSRCTTMELELGPIPFGCHP